MTKLTGTTFFGVAIALLSCGLLTLTQPVSAAPAAPFPTRSASTRFLSDRTFLLHHHLLLTSQSSCDAAQTQCVAACNSQTGDAQTRCISDCNDVRTTCQ